MSENNITIIGSGVWGSALGKLFDAAKIIPGRTDEKHEISGIAIIVVKSGAVREVLQKHDFTDSTVIICSKGVEQETLKLMNEVVREVLPNNKIAILSGPNFAVEIEQGLPAATTLACADAELGKELVSALGKKNFRVYLTNDLATTQIAGAVKNVFAIACGICEGLKLGDNARAAVITRGIAELARLCAAKGGNPENLMGLAGFGDLVLTCTSTKSRNYQLGVDIANNGSADGVISEDGGVKEGYYTAKSVYDLAKSLNVEMPICTSVYEILYNNKKLDETINELLQRPQA